MRIRLRLRGLWTHSFLFYFIQYFFRSFFPTCLFNCACAACGPTLFYFILFSIFFVVFSHMLIQLRLRGLWTHSFLFFLFSIFFVVFFFHMRIQLRLRGLWTLADESENVPKKQNYNTNKEYDKKKYMPRLHAY